MNNSAVYFFNICPWDSTSLSFHALKPVDAGQIPSIQSCHILRRIVVALKQFASPTVKIWDCSD